MTQPLSNYPLKDKLMEDMKVFMKAKDQKNLGFVRMLLSEVKNIEINNRESFQPEMGLKAIVSYAKKLQKSLGEFKSDPVRLQAVEEELAFCQNYLPKGLSEEEIRSKLKNLVDSKPEEKNLSVLMREAMKMLGGQADGQKIQLLLKELLP